MCQCEDRPCCGHLAEERADDAYWAERIYLGDDDFYADQETDDDDQEPDDYEVETGDFYERQTSWHNRD
jgi:hypothetical protein